MVKLNTVNARNAWLKHAHFSDFFLVLGRFLYFKNPVKYMPILCINQERPDRPPAARQCSNFYLYISIRYATSALNASSRLFRYITSKSKSPPPDPQKPAGAVTASVNMALHRASRPHRSECAQGPRRRTGGRTWLRFRHEPPPHRHAGMRRAGFVHRGRDDPAASLPAGWDLWAELHRLGINMSFAARRGNTDIRRRAGASRRPCPSGRRTSRR